MKAKNGDIWLARATLQELASLPPETLTVRGKYQVVKLARILGAHFQDMETARVKLVQQFGQKTDGGFTVPPGAATRQFQESFGEILDVEEEVAWTPVALAEKDVAALTIAQILALDKFLTVSEPAPEESPNGASKEPLTLVK